MVLKKIIVAFESEINCHRISTLLESKGIEVIKSCRAGADIIRFTEYIEEGIIICGYKLTDMTAADLIYNLNERAQLIVIGNAEQLEFISSEEAISLITPISNIDLFSSLRMLLMSRDTNSQRKNKTRSEDENRLLKKAKEILMQKNNLTEAQAYRFIQKKSMDSSLKLMDMAKIIIESHESII